MSLADKLQKLRMDRGWSQDYVSKLMNVSRSTISKYETGTYLPTYQTVLQLADVYKCDKDYLVSELDSILQSGLVVRHEKAPYILNEDEMDPDLEIICDLARSDELVKEVFLELYALDEKTRSSVLRGTKAFIREFTKKK